MKINHIGLHLHTVMKCQKDRLNVIVRRAGYSQSAFYRHINCARLPKEILEKYAKAMNIEFLPSVLYNDNESVMPYAELVKERDYWRDKYYELLAKYNEFLMENYEKIYPPKCK